MWRITLPCILPTIVIMLIIRIGNLVEVGSNISSCSIAHPPTRRRTSFPPSFTARPAGHPIRSCDWPPACSTRSSPRPRLFGKSHQPKSLVDIAVVRS
nr:hypothetical protein [Agrobacterium fabrum]